MNQIRTYQGRISRAMLDRMDILMRLQPVSFEAMNDKTACEDSRTIRSRVERVHQRQRERYVKEGIRFNSQLTPEQLQIFCRLTSEEEAFMKQVFEQKQLSGRGYHRLLRVARTIADMEECTEIRLEHLEEAVAYRISLPGEERMI